jgi:hypothetical protein
MGEYQNAINAANEVTVPISTFQKLDKFGKMLPRLESYLKLIKTET